MSGSLESVITQVQLNGQEYCFVKAEDRTRFSYVDPNGHIICGTLDQIAEHVTEGIRLPRVHILLEPTPAEWTTLIPLMGYTTSGGGIFTPTDPPEFNVQVKYGSVDTGNYVNGKVDVAIARGQQGMNPLSLELQIVSKDYNLDTAWSASAYAEDAAYEFTTGTLELYSASRRFNSFVYSHNNNLRQRFNNSVTADVIQSVSRVIHFGVNTPFTADEVDIVQHFMSAARLEGVAGTATFTRGNQSLEFDAPYMLWEAKAPDIIRKDAEVRNMAFFKVFAAGSDPMVTLTSDSTP